MDYRRPRSRKQAMRRRKHRQKMLLKIIPLLVVLVALLVGAIIFASSGVLDDLSYSDKKEDIEAYFGDCSNTEAIVIKDDEYTDERVTIIDGIPYVNYETVKSDYVSRFYKDDKYNQILYTNATETIRTNIGSSSYGPTGVEYTLPVPTTVLRGETLYMSFDYLKLYTTLDYKVSGGTDGTPYRIEVYTENKAIKTASLTADKAIRSSYTKKSPILKKPGEGTTVRVINPHDGEIIPDGWARVMTDDMFMGYIETKHLSDISDSQISVNVVEPLHIDGNVRENKIVLGWSMIAGQAGNDVIYSQIDNSPGMNVISPTWFALQDNDGNISSLASQSVVDTCHSKGIEVWGMFDNFTYNDVKTAYVLGDTDIRAKVISGIVALANQYNLDGINVDFESLSEEAGEPFIQFIRELSIECRNNNLVLSVDNYVPKAYTNLYNRKEQGVFADYVIIMGYDEHYNGSSEVGSVASIGYVTEGIQKTLDEVPANKVINGLPFYTRMWRVENKTDAELDTAPTGADGQVIDYNIVEVQTLPMQQAIETVASHSGATKIWDESTKQNYAQWESGNSTTKIWLEDADSLNAKLQVMTGFDIAGAAVWQIGYGAKFAWDTINQYY